MNCEYFNEEFNFCTLNNSAECPSFNELTGQCLLAVADPFPTDIWDYEANLNRDFSDEANAYRSKEVHPHDS
jgi:hypothetical protein